MKGKAKGKNNPPAKGGTQDKNKYAGERKGKSAKNGADKAAGKDP